MKAQMLFITIDLNVQIRVSELSDFDLFMEITIIHCFPVPENESSAWGWQ